MKTESSFVDGTEDGCRKEIHRGLFESCIKRASEMKEERKDEGRE